MAHNQRTRMADEENVDPRTWKKGKKSPANLPSATKRKWSVLGTDLQVDEIDGIGTRKRILTEILAEEMNDMRMQTRDGMDREKKGAKHSEVDPEPTETADTWTFTSLPRRPITRSVAERDSFKKTPKSPTDLQWPVNLRKKALEAASKRRQSLDSQSTRGTYYSMQKEPSSPRAVESIRMPRK
uniref:Uncharacterized protein n=1 Tax=Picocystis salinarum TaxID=88271 RepID=A0A6U9RG50_9CHLO|mmetsp:Transcript_9271/g.56445  ORF Transcript_9271/g.56445 Transcript_9271/m.56445 type:complete len:184 (+) Transcript_9271:54-605(+)|eukprot:CAMPEP_0113931442 /NCGR_PEP_ID=MMETSP1159-20121227/6547_1 /TAXON_ID=88271 /ORGANISM="Picocystis salinarum" /LENGTH=183 /DNA_ID=CAMNT_0000932415 /DNA_START=9 /DNA_END=560 /DNA_ORIENTATION=+ /assembly_acc=CAM_ASM_000767